MMPETAPQVEVQRLTSMGDIIMFGPGLRERGVPD